MSSQLTSLQRQLAQRDVLIHELELERHSQVLSEQENRLLVPPVTPVTETSIVTQLGNKKQENTFKKSKGMLLFCF